MKPGSVRRPSSRGAGRLAAAGPRQPRISAPSRPISSAGIVRVKFFTLPERQSRISSPLISLDFSVSVRGYERYLKYSEFCSDSADPAFIQAVAKAHLWWMWIKSGEVESLAEIARREGIDKGQVTRWLRLAFLSPMLVRQIRAGTHPASLTIETLTREYDLPVSWLDQENLVAALT